MPDLDRFLHRKSAKTTPTNLCMYQQDLFPHSLICWHVSSWETDFASPSDERVRFVHAITLTTQDPLRMDTRQSIIISQYGELLCPKLHRHVVLISPRLRRFYTHGIIAYFHISNMVCLQICYFLSRQFTDQELFPREILYGFYHILITARHHDCNYSFRCFQC